VILNIVKAYDIVDRFFLFRIMAVAGCGRPMLQWVPLPLSYIRENTADNGQVSKAQVWQAGVGQGCPLSPLFYLFVADALDKAAQSWASWWPVRGLHDADDTKVFPSSLQPNLV
jgi:hypothetical protein